MLIFKALSALLSYPTAEMREAFAIIDRGLEITDKAVA